MALWVKLGCEGPGCPGGWIALGWCYREGLRRGEQIDRPLATKAGEASPRWPRSFDHSGDPATLSNIRMRSEGEAFAVILSNPARAGSSAVKNLLCSSATASLSGL